MWHILLLIPINFRVLKYLREPGPGPNRALITHGDSLQGPTESRSIQALYPRIGFLAYKLPEPIIFQLIHGLVSKNLVHLSRVALEALALTG